MTRLLGVIIITLSLGEPGEECLGRLANLLAGREVDVFLAGASAPFGDDFFAENVVVVEKHQDLGGQVVDVWVRFATKSDESFNASKEGFFVFLRGDHL
jgi:hypothetical protein